MSIEISEEHGVRFLHFGSHWVQGAMRLSRPWDLELEYTREMMMPLVLRPDPAWPASVLQVGLGAASVTKFLYRHRREARITVVEIDPEVVTAAYQFFALPRESERLRIQIEDGYEYVGRTHRRFDLIVVDGFDADARPGKLDSVAFYARCRERLSPSGIMVVNVLRRRQGVTPSVERIQRAFGDRVLVVPPREAGNTIVLALGGAPFAETFEDLRAAAFALKRSTGLGLGGALARLARRRKGRALVV